MLGVLTLGIDRALTRLVRGLQVPGARKLATVSSCLPFTVMAETRKVVFFFFFFLRGLHLLEMKVKDFSGLPFSQVI